MFLQMLGRIVLVALGGYFLVGCAPAPGKPDAQVSLARLGTPAIVPVPVWGGTATDALIEGQTVRRITLHHQGETWHEGADVSSYLRRLQQWSRLTKHWADIPYHYIVAPDGKIYAGRDAALAGDTNTEYDPQGHALVMLLGNFEDTHPAPAQLQSTITLVAWLLQHNRLSLDDVATHRDFSTQTVCPGRNFYALVASGWLRSALVATLAGRPYASP